VEGAVDWTKERKQLEAQQKGLKEWLAEQEKQAALAQCLPLIAQLLDIEKEGKQLRAERQALFAGENLAQTCEDLRTNWAAIHQHLAHTQASIDKLTEEKQALTDRIESASLSLSRASLQAGFGSIEEAGQWRLSDADYQRLKEEGNALDRALAVNRQTLKALQQQQQQLQGQLKEADSEALSAQYQEQKQALADLNEQWEEVKRLLRNQEENSRRQQETQAKIDQEEQKGRKWELLNQLIGDANGNRFNDFAQELTLRQLLGLANQRLKQLSDRYAVTTPLEEEGDALVAIDHHMGGQRRSVKTLSGGETFILSLALALALSDLAAKNVVINSLFIDEGFGTLDPETLDQTIDTLEKLQLESSKIIGVISHVEALKERINTQVRLSRDGQGHSKLELV
jgi:exonuclease SbcC